MQIKDKCYCSKCLREIEPVSTCPYCGFDAERYTDPDYALPMDTFLHDRYHVGSVIGAGGFGITYAGWDITLNKPVAIKEFFPRQNVSRDTGISFCVKPVGTEADKLLYYKGVGWFQKEARILAALGDTPNIVHVEDYFKENDTAYIIMDFIRGKTLTEYAREKGGKLSPAEVFPLLREPIKALQKVHQFDMLHRDISPDNLIIDENGAVHLIDFGAATSLDHNSEFKSTELFYKNNYSPPEQTSESNQGSWSDIYSICATIVFLLTGKEMPSCIEREQNDTLPAILRTIKLKWKQKKALIHGLQLKVKQRTENLALLLHELYNEPFPKSELERQRQELRKHSLILLILVSYCLIGFGWGYKLHKLIPDVLKAWGNKDASLAINLAHDFVFDIYPGGEKAADYWYRYGARYGTDEQKKEIALIYQEGIKDSYQEDDPYFYRPDFEFARDLLIECSEHGYSEAINRLGWMYWKGMYADRDLDLAVSYLEAASDSGNSNAMVNLALLNIQEYKDYEKAYSLLSQASDLDNYEAMYHLALMYEKGDYVEKNTTKTLEYIIKAAEARVPDAMAYLGSYYLNNDFILETGDRWRDVASGIYYVQAGSFRGSAVADYVLAHIWIGDIDVSDSIEADNRLRINPKLAFTHMLSSAENGYLPAMLELSQMYTDGYGTEKNPDAALEWGEKYKSASGTE